MCVSKVEVFKEIIYISQNKCFDIFVALKCLSTLIVLKYSFKITPKEVLKNVVIQGITFFSNRNTNNVPHFQAIENKNL